MSTLEICFGDTVRLGNSDIGIVAFIGYTQFKKDTVFYGINLKQNKGKQNSTYDNITYFKCPKTHRVFTVKENIIEILKKHTVSASFYHGQNVTIINNIGNGKLLYIGNTKYDGFQNIFYGVKLNKHLKEKYISQIKKNPHIYYLYKNKKNHKKMIFNADLQHSIFVRQNQLRSLNDENKRKSLRQKHNKHNAENENKQNHLKIREQHGQNRRSLSMQPRKKPKSQQKKPLTPRISRSKITTTSQSESKETSKNSKKKKSDKNKNKNDNDNAKREKIRDKRIRNAIQIHSDLGAIRKSVSAPKAKSKKKIKSATRPNTPKTPKTSKTFKTPKSPKRPKTPTIARTSKTQGLFIANSKQHTIKFNGCETPTKSTKKSKSKKEIINRPALSKANSASYVSSEKQKKKALELAEKKKAMENAAGRQTLIQIQKSKRKSTPQSQSIKIKTNASSKKRNSTSKTNKKGKQNRYIARKRSISANSSNKPKMGAMSRSVSSSTSSSSKKNKKGSKKKKKKKKKRQMYTVDDSLVHNTKKPKSKYKSKQSKFHVIREDEEDDDDMLSYQDIISDKEKFLKYIDSKNFYYHKQFMKNDEDARIERNKVLQKKQIVSEIKERRPPPSMVSFFSSKSRVNQRKKRALPSAPKIYTITIRARPLGFFIETKKLNTIIQDKGNGEHKTEQVEIVDNKNKFNQVNAYISSIASEEWQSIIVVGSQLLSINDENITGLSFSKIFNKLSQQKLPFDLKLAAPRDYEINNNLLPNLSINGDSNGSDNSSNYEIMNNYNDYNNNDDDDMNGYEISSNSSSNWSGISDIPRGRGQTIDETKFTKQTDKKKKRFKFKLF